jgi:hypothetical protein
MTIAIQQALPEPEFRQEKGAINLSFLKLNHQQTCQLSSPTRRGIFCTQTQTPPTATPFPPFSTRPGSNTACTPVTQNPISSQPDQVGSNTSGTTRHHRSNHDIVISPLQDKTCPALQAEGTYRACSKTSLSSLYGNGKHTNPLHQHSIILLGTIRTACVYVPHARHHHIDTTHPPYLSPSSVFLFPFSLPLISLLTSTRATLGIKSTQKHLATHRTSIRFPFRQRYLSTTVCVSQTKSISFIMPSQATQKCSSTGAISPLHVNSLPAILAFPEQQRNS